jgi:hypothetical protein
MTFATVLICFGLLFALVYRRVQGRPVCSTRQLFLLPILVTILGINELSHPRLNAMDIAVAVAGCAVSLLLGAFRGTRVKISWRDGTPWVRWGAAAVVIFAINVVAKLALDGAGVALGGTTSGVTASLVLAAGLMLAGEAAVVWVRVQTGGRFSSDQDSTAAGAPDLSTPAQQWAQARALFERA